MTPSFTFGLLAAAIGLPYSLWSLHKSNQVFDAAPWPTLAPVIPLPRRSEQSTTVHVLTPATPATPSPGVAGVRSSQVVAPAEGGAAPDLKPVVTPSPEKAGEVRRVQGTPCHDCPCCAAYATRMKVAHDEIERLRDEVLHHEAGGVSRAASLQTVTRAARTTPTL